MRHLVGVAAIATALVIAVPVWAQTGAPTTPTSSAPQSVSSEATAQAMPSHAAPRHWMGHRRAMRRGWGRLRALARRHFPSPRGRAAGLGVRPQIDTLAEKAPPTR